MDGMVERVARAICPQAFDGSLSPLVGGDGPIVTIRDMQEAAYENARAAIAAMREPTEAMLEEAALILPDCPWREMIDAALKD